MPRRPAHAVRVGDLFVPPDGGAKRPIIERLSSRSGMPVCFTDSAGDTYEFGPDELVDLGE